MCFHHSGLQSYPFELKTWTLMFFRTIGPTQSFENCNDICMRSFGSPHGSGCCRFYVHLFRRTLWRRPRWRVLWIHWTSLPKLFPSCIKDLGICCLKHKLHWCPINMHHMPWKLDWNWWFGPVFLPIKNGDVCGSPKGAWFRTISFSDYWSSQKKRWSSLWLTLV